MSIVLFAMIGNYVGAGATYWLCYGLFCAFKLYYAIKEVVKDLK